MTTRTPLRLARLAQETFGVLDEREHVRAIPVPLGASWEYPRRARAIRSRRHVPDAFGRLPIGARRLAWVDVRHAPPYHPPRKRSR